jgi:D-alanyl-D-alanine carboxypeptidase (penicillin-binding protein 5/6)
MISRPSRGTAATLLLALCLVVLGLTSLTGQAVGLSATTLPPVTSTTSTTLSTGAPAVGGAAAILVNMEDGRVLYEKKADARRAIASTTKIMTGTVALESLPLDRIVTASKHATEAGESEIWLVPGEKLSVEDMLYGLLIKSGNDAAVALAEASAGSEKAFVARMNAKAAKLGMKNTHFSDPHGLDRADHYSSARDMSILGRYAMQNKTFRTIVGTAKTTIPWPGHTYDRTLKNHNTLVGKVPYVTGIKTGYTGKAGFCLVASGTRDGVSMVAVILGEPTAAQRDSDIQKLLEYGFGKYRHVVLAEKGVEMAQVDVPYHFKEQLPLVTDARLEKTVYIGDEVGRTVSVQSDLTLPVAAGDVVGTVTYQIEGQPADTVDLVATRSIEKPTLAVKLRYLFDRVGFLMGWTA